MSSDQYTPNTDLQEQIAGALVARGARFAYQIGPLEARALAAAALPIVEEHARAAAKAAWDQCAQEQGAWPQPQGDPRALTYVLLANNPYTPKEETPDEQ